MAEDQNGSEKTEEATPRKLKQAREEGQVAFSVEINTALLLAAAKHPPVVAFLLFSRADPNASTNGATPLLVACRACNLECVQLLVGAGADATAKSAQGDTALDVAEAQRRVRGDRLELGHRSEANPAVADRARSPPRGMPRWRDRR